VSIFCGSSVCVRVSIYYFGVSVFGSLETLVLEYSICFDLQNGNYQFVKTKP
jgi:hypothetical protein